MDRKIRILKGAVLLVSISLFISLANADLIVPEPAKPAKGYSKPAPGYWGEGLSYISPDAKYMLVYEWVAPGGPVYLAERIWNEQLQQWNEATLLSFSGGPTPISSGCYLSPDGNTLYYHAYGPVNSDIWRAHRVGNVWSNMERLESVSTSEPDHHPSFNGHQIYFQIWYHDIWVSDYDLTTDQFSTSVPVSSINTSAYREEEPWISSDGTLLTFTSDRPGGFGGFDLWYATWDPTTVQWTNITNFGPNVNTAGDASGGRFAEQAGILFFHQDGVLMEVSVVLEPAIEVTIDINPATLNLKSTGKWITCYIELPEGYDVADIDVQSILLEGLLEVQHSDVQNGMLMVKFDREDLIFYLESILGIQTPDDVTLMVIGELADGTPFEGSDTIRVIN